MPTKENGVPCHETQTSAPDPEAKVPPSLSAHQALAWYRDMLLIRRFEERAGQLYGMGQIAGFCHLYIGQEAVAVGTYAAMQPQDTMITAYRDHGHMLACGMSARGVMAELTGRASGVSKGKGGSMHMFSRDKGFFGGHGIVGAQVPLGAGMALGHQYRGDQGVCLTFMGDGASNQGQVYEALNMAALWKLPVVFIIENNGYAMGTSEARSCAGTGLFQRAQGWGVTGVQVDGMNVVAVHQAAHQAIEAARRGNGPQWLEMVTYRYRGHSMSDPAKYRKRDEVDDVRNTRDPLLLLRKLMEDQFQITEEVLKDMESEVRNHVADAATFATEAPLPEASELWTDIWVEG